MHLKVLALVCVMSMTCHFMRGRCRKFFSIISLITPLEKSMLVMPVQPSSYLQRSSKHPFHIQAQES